MLQKKELVKWMKLTQVPKLGPSKIMKLFRLISDLDKIFTMADNELLRTRVFNEPMLIDFHKLKEALEENFIKAISECEENNIKIIPLIDKRYPDFLKNIPYPPLTLFLKGDLNLLYVKKVAIVGSRKADEPSQKWAYNIAQDFVKKGYAVVSGGAIGIDYSAHKGALDANGKTICVLGSGFFKMFPECHLALFQAIAEKGLLISEHLPNFPGSAIALVQRNRITSGISDALIMVASGEKGGAMIQTKIAFEQRVPIFCPDRSLNLRPNVGIPQVINEWKGIEIKSCEEVLKVITSPESQINLSQF
ncbi:DNA-protecting protein DprA [Candidatus Woesearchaeota archaeon]|nr:DNA-protecting protein DprA [Candidatus Woesearchaeota archaeon]